jgi:hypothetical protein
MTWTLTPDGTSTVEIIDDKGKPHKSSPPWSGGKEVSVTGEGIENMTIITSIQGRTLEETGKVKGTVIQTIHTVLSPDGRTLTTTDDATDEQGRPVHGVLLSEKQ